MARINVYDLSPVQLGQESRKFTINGIETEITFRQLDSVEGFAVLGKVSDVIRDYMGIDRQTREPLGNEVVPLHYIGDKEPELSVDLIETLVKMEYSSIPTDGSVYNWKELLAIMMAYPMVFLKIMTFWKSVQETPLKNLETSTEAG